MWATLTTRRSKLSCSIYALGKSIILGALVRCPLYPPKRPEKRPAKRSLCAISDQSASQQLPKPELVSGSLRDPRVDFGAESREVDWLTEERLGAACQRPPLGVLVAIGRDHDDRNVRP